MTKNDQKTGIQTVFAMPSFVYSYLSTLTSELILSFSLPKPHILQLTKDKNEVDEQLKELDTMNKDLDKLVADLRKKLKNSDEEHGMK